MLKNRTSTFLLMLMCISMNSCVRVEIIVDNHEEKAQSLKKVIALAPLVDHQSCQAINGSQREAIERTIAKCLRSSHVILPSQLRSILGAPPEAFESLHQKCLLPPLNTKAIAAGIDYLFVAEVTQNDVTQKARFVPGSASESNPSGDSISTLTVINEAQTMREMTAMYSLLDLRTRTLIWQSRAKCGLGCSNTVDTRYSNRPPKFPEVYSPVELMNKMSSKALSRLH